MKKFLYQVIAFFAAIVLMYFLISILPSNDTGNKNDYMASIVDKHKLSNSIKTPKIILAGGSNVAFGIDSELVEKTLNRKVVNLGIHAGLGLNFMLNELKDMSKKGDVIFLSPEYFLSVDGDYKLKKLTSSYFSVSKKYYDNNIIEDLEIHVDRTRKNLKNFSLKDINKTLKNDTLFSVNNIYSRKAFNSYGDVISHLTLKKPESLTGGGELMYEYWEGIKLINEFNEYAEKNGIKIFYLFPNYPVSEYEKNRVAINKLEIDLRRDLKVKILNKPSDFVFDDSLFYDTVYHLDKNGKNIRTKIFLELVKGLLN